MCDTLDLSMIHSTNCMVLPGLSKACVSGIRFLRYKKIKKKNVHMFKGFSNREINYMWLVYMCVDVCYHLSLC